MKCVFIVEIVDFEADFQHFQMNLTSHFEKTAWFFLYRIEHIEQFRKSNAMIKEAINCEFI